jgi:hypothetical protein
VSERRLQIADSVALEQRRYRTARVASWPFSTSLSPVHRESE